MMTEVGLGVSKTHLIAFHSMTCGCVQDADGEHLHVCETHWTAPRWHDLALRLARAVRWLLPYAPNGIERNGAEQIVAEAAHLTDAPAR